MRTKTLILILFFLASYLYGQNRIAISVFGNGGSDISNSNYQISSTVGQTLIGKIQGSNFRLQSGFWKPAQILTPVENQEDVIPKVYKLEQNYPNPFNPTTTIKYSIKERSFVELVIYDILGREVVVLLNEEQDAGNYKVNFNAKQLASGIYLYRLQAGDFIDIKKMILLK